MYILVRRVRLLVLIHRQPHLLHVQAWAAVASVADLPADQVHQVVAAVVLRVQAAVAVDDNDLD